MNLTPREDFRKSAHANGWGDLVSSPQFEAAAKAAMLELQDALIVPTQDPITSANNCFRLHGAKLFLGILMSLTETTTQPERKAVGLNYKA